MHWLTSDCPDCHAGIKHVHGNQAKALEAFFTSEVDLPPEARSVQPGDIWWEPSDGWLCPWRIVRHTTSGATGYPCGQPKRK